MASFGSILKKYVPSLKDYGISEKLGGKKTSVQAQAANAKLQKSAVMDTAAAKLGGWDAVNKKAKENAAANKPTVLGSSNTKSSGITTSKSSASSPSSSYQSAMASSKQRSDSYDKDTESIISKSNKSIADAEAEAARQRAALVGQYDSASQALIDRMNALENPEAAYSRIATEEGLSSAQDVSKGLREQLDRVAKLLKTTDEGVTARSLQSGLTEAQRQRLIESESQPLREQYADLSTGLTGATANEQMIRDNISAKLSAFYNGQEQSLEPLKQALASVEGKIGFELPEISANLGRQITQYTADRQTRLDALLKRYDRQEALSDAEMVEASQLAKEERNFAQTTSQFASILEAAGAGGNQPVTAGVNVQQAPTTVATPLDDMFNSIVMGGGMIPSSTGL
jgi:hypothetical protein